MILEDIAAAAAKRVDKAKKQLPAEKLREAATSMPIGNFTFEKALRAQDISFICEVKKASPSKGIISEDFPYLDIAHEYEAAGANAISVLTEPDFFQGSDSILKEIRQNIDLPLLRKDFTIDEYQLYEAKTLGAHAVLLICALLEVSTLRRYLEICENLGLSALVEAHTLQEVKAAVSAGARVIGVNNRNLKTFEVDIATCIRLRSAVPEEILYVAESGIRNSDDIEILREARVDAVLIGETLMRSRDKRKALEQLKGGLK